MLYKQFDCLCKRSLCSLFAPNTLTLLQPDQKSSHYPPVWSVDTNFVSELLCRLNYLRFNFLICKLTVWINSTFFDFLWSLLSVSQHVMFLVSVFLKQFANVIDNSNYTAIKMSLLNLGKWTLDDQNCP